MEAALRRASVLEMELRWKGAGRARLSMAERAASLLK